MINAQRIWFTGDTHFGHANVIEHAGRPFASVEEMDEALIENWNATVHPRDQIFHVGDFAWRDATRYRDRLHGNIHLIVGNHDAAAIKIKERFIWVRDVYMLKHVKVRVWLSHYSHEIWPRAHHGAWHCYGHSHNSLPARRHARSLDVGVDAVACRLAGDPMQGGKPPAGFTKSEDYRPMSFDEVAAVMATREWRPVDHHTRDCGP